MGAARLYKTFSPYPDTVVADLDYAQSADVVYTVHLDYPVQRATRTSHTDWTYEEATFAPTIAAPAAPTIAVTNPNSTGYMATDYEYLITAVGGTPEEESRPSTSVTATNDLTLNGNYNTLTLPARPAGVDRYVIYKKMAGAFGYIGNTTDTTFKDGTPQLQPVLSDTPPEGRNPFTGAGLYPSTAAFHNQRLILARTRDLPNAVWGSQPANFQNMDVSRPAKDDDALSFSLVAERVNSVNQAVSMNDLMLLTSDGIFATNGGPDGTPITPTAISPKRGNSRGASRLNPIVIDEIIFYTPNKGTSVRALGYKFDIDGYQSNNVSIFSPHFFLSHNIVSWAYVEDPYSAIFAAREDGVGLCFTWEAEQNVWGWTKIETDGKFLWFASITEGGFDRLYALVERVIGGVTRRFYERLALPHGSDITRACHLDCAVTQLYSPAQNIMYGLYHLEGQLVSAYYDGYVAHDLLVTNGSITLPDGYEAEIISAGLRFSGEIETLPMVLKTQDGVLQVDKQNVSRIVVRTVDTRGLQVGITGADLEAVTERTGGEEGLPDVSQVDYDVTPPGHWDASETLTLLQEEPLPAHITGLFVDPKVSNK
jgi:hypothetical protein